jgi:hypothetical protein
VALPVVELQHVLALDVYAMHIKHGLCFRVMSFQKGSLKLLSRKGKVQLMWYFTMMMLDLVIYKYTMTTTQQHQMYNVTSLKFVEEC